MCDFENNIKFCRCKTKTAEAKPTWTLKRHASADWMTNDWMTLEQGRCHLPSYDKSEKMTAEQIVTALNILQADCFDMAYQAVEGDTLNIEMPINNTHYEFEFSNGAWRQQGSISKHINQDLIIASGWIDDVSR